MGTVKTFLLVSDDPDDHQLLFEAIKEISKEIVLTILLEGDHLIPVLNDEKIRPDYIVLDTTVVDNEIELIVKLRTLKKLKDVPVLLYVDAAEGPSNYPAHLVLSKMLRYSQLRSKLKTLLTP
jgi:hypothetical protein